MEEIRYFLEEKSNLKCCIAQRDSNACDTDDFTALEQNLKNSASTVVLWSRAALASKLHKFEYKLARHIELHRNFDFRVIHICLEDMSDVTDDNLKLILMSNEYILWNSEATHEQKEKFFDRLLEKIYKRLAGI